MEIDLGPNVPKPTSSQSGEDEEITMIISGVIVCIACNSWSTPEDIQYLYNLMKRTKSYTEQNVKIRHVIRR